MCLFLRGGTIVSWGVILGQNIVALVNWRISEESKQTGGGELP